MVYLEFREKGPRSLGEKHFRENSQQRSLHAQEKRMSERRFGAFGGGKRNYRPQWLCAVADAAPAGGGGQGSFCSARLGSQEQQTRVRHRTKNIVSSTDRFPSLPPLLYIAHLSNVSPLHIRGDRSHLGRAPVSQVGRDKTCVRKILF